MRADSADEVSILMRSITHAVKFFNIKMNGWLFAFQKSVALVITRLLQKRRIESVLNPKKKGLEVLPEEDIESLTHATRAGDGKSKASPSSYEEILRYTYLYIFNSFPIFMSSSIKFTSTLRFFYLDITYTYYGK